MVCADVWLVVLSSLQIMLGLVTHEPHFSLLREEVQFGRKAKRQTSPDVITFHLLHLSILREYIDYEFSSVKVGTHRLYIYNVHTGWKEARGYGWLPAAFTFLCVSTGCVYVLNVLSYCCCTSLVQEGLAFGYDLEAIIDDWVLMGYLVGNDFIPNLPNMHIKQVWGRHVGRGGGSA